MTSKDMAIAREFKQRLSAAMKLLDFKVFGSRARGQGDEFSDLDIFLEVETLPREREKEILDIAWEVGFKNFLVISPVIFTRDELENSPLRSSPLAVNVRREGVSV